MGLVREIARELALSEPDVSRILMTGPRRYKVFPILKRSGGERIIAQPSRELKDIQRFILAKKLIDLPIHAAATAYVKGKNIRQNALSHSKQRVILKLDFRNFFPSIVFAGLEMRLVATNFSAVARDEWGLLRNALFWNPKGTARLCLSIGAPTSPFISNAVMYDIDERISRIVWQHSAIYTRYADDISISAETIEILEAVESKISIAISESNRPTLQFNLDKRGIYTKAGRRIVTGLVITPEGRVSLGRARKRAISVAVHHIKTSQNTTSAHLAATRGWLAHALAVEPHFLRTLRGKYGSVVDELLKLPAVRSTEVISSALS